MIELEQIQKHYPGFSLDISLSIPEGTITGLIGRNGSGKTTIFKTLLGLIAPDGGSAKVFGEAADSLSVAQKQKIGVVLADSGFPPMLKLRDIKKILKNFYSDFDVEWFEKKLQEFGLHENKKIQNLSTGLHVRFKILCALSHHPDLLILDEPTSGLDVIARDEILDLLREFMEEGAHSILISSHISSDLENLCDDFCVIDKGKLLLHEDANALDENWCVLQMKPEQFQKLEKDYVHAWKKTPYGIQALSSQKQFWQENYPDLCVEKASLDAILELLVMGEKV